MFGFAPDDFSERAERYRIHRLCPFNNRVANCTKDKANDPLGVCSMVDSTGSPVITCPVRFRQDWLILQDAAAFFFSPDLKWTSLTETRLEDSEGVSAGNIDHVLVAYDAQGRVMDFGAVEVQAVYISGNIRRAFEHYMQNPKEHITSDWSRERNYPRPDYLSSSRKRLAPQLLYKGGILHTWGKKQAVVLHRAFFNTLPLMPEVDETEAEIVWLIYDLNRGNQEQYQLTLYRKVYTLFEAALSRLATPQPGAIQNFLLNLQSRLNAKLTNGDTLSDITLPSDIL
ncbi:MAG: NotI family restriction endonuclease [bacterium]|nr:NotI family restriction endonuclease [bacterium]